MDLPAVVTTDLRLNEPRFVKLPEIMKAKTKPLETIPLASLGRRRTMRVKVTKTEAAAGAPARHHGEGRRRTVRRAAQAGPGMTQVRF